MIPTNLTPLILQGNVLDVLRSLPAESVHCVVTSPPFWGLRRYDVCSCSTKRFTSETLRVWDAANRSHDSTGQGAGSDDPRTRKNPDPNCRWCGGTGTIPGQEVRWGGDPDCEHEWGTTPPRRTRTANGTVNPNSPSFGTGQNYEAKGGRTCTKCGGWFGGLGLEPTPQLYVAHMIDVFREVRRVLRDDGIAWCEIGDTFLTDSPIRGSSAEAFSVRWDPADTASRGGSRRSAAALPGIRAKSLALVPERLAIALSDDGWIVRRDVVWDHRNPMPESVRDRPTSAHSYVWMLVKRGDYYYDQENGREPQTGNAHPRGNGVTPKSAPEGSDIRAKQSWHASTTEVYVPGGRNMLSIWRISPQPSGRKHYAAFPEALVERCVKVATPDRGCCPECGAPFERATSLGEPDRGWQRSAGSDANGEYSGVSVKTVEGTGAQDPSEVKRRVLAGMRPRITVGWTPTCSHYPDPCDRCGAAWKRSKVTRRVSTFNVRVRDAKAGRLAQKSGLGATAADATAEEIGAYKEGSDAAQYRTEEAEVGWPSCSCLRQVPGVVLDPFAGSGTTLAVAKQLGRRAIGIELSPAYVEMARERVAEARTETTHDPAQRRLGEFEGALKEDEP